MKDIVRLIGRVAAGLLLVVLLLFKGAPAMAHMDANGAGHGATAHYSVAWQVTPASSDCMAVGTKMAANCHDSGVGSEPCRCHCGSGHCAGTTGMILGPDRLLSPPPAGNSVPAMVATASAAGISISPAARPPKPAL